MPAVAQNSTSRRIRRSRADTLAATLGCSGCLERRFGDVPRRGVVKLSGGDYFGGSASASWFVASLPTSHEMATSGLPVWSDRNVRIADHPARMLEGT